MPDEQMLMLADIGPTGFEVGVLNGRVEPGDVVVVVGAGPVGLAAIMGARLFSPLHIVEFDESGHGKGLLIDFNYDIEPLPGTFPRPVVGPLSLLKETRANHLGKLAFRWIYWNVLLPGRRLPIPIRMSMLGKDSSPTRSPAPAPQE